MWVYDELFGFYFPVEVDHDFLQFERYMRDGVDVEHLVKGRSAQIYRYMLLPEPGRDMELGAMKQFMSDHGYVKIPKMLNELYCRDMLTSYYFRNEHLHERWRDMPGIIRTSANDMPLMRLFHAATERLVNRLIDEPVKMSYSFTAAYETGSNLPAHTDRPQCVYNVSLMLGSNPDGKSLAGWPLYIVDNHGHLASASLEPGDAVLYSGVKNKHWRDVMPEGFDKILGVFFHYVPQDFQGSLA